MSANQQLNIALAYVQSDRSDTDSNTKPQSEATDVGDAPDSRDEVNDVEKGTYKNDSKASESSQDLNLIEWSGPDDPENPKNWPHAKKWGVTIIVSLFSFISPLTSSMAGPALSQQASDLHMTNTVAIEASLSIFILAWAVGPFFLAPLSEVYGRVRILQYSNLLFIAWNLGCGFAQNGSEIIVFRFLAGLGGSAQLSAGAGVLADCWNPEERGKAVSIYSLGPTLGSAIGPILGGWIAQKSTWRWVYWSTSIADALVQLAGLYFLTETHNGKLLRKRAVRLRNETGNHLLHTTEHDKNLSGLLSTALKRPFVMIGTQPIVQVLALYLAYLFGMFYLLFTTFSTVFQDVYGETLGIASLHYIALGLGFGAGGVLNTMTANRLYLRLKKKNGGVSKPEYRAALMIPASLLVPIGLLWYGWSAQAKVFWLMPDIGIFIFGLGAMICVQCSQAYVVDSYQRYAASGMAAAVVFRSVAGFAFPLFAPSMYEALHYGWGNTVLAFVSIVVGVPAPILLWCYGEKLRARSQYAAG